MKMNKVKKICKSAGVCQIVMTDPSETMIEQWIGTHGVWYAVRETMVTYKQLRLMWDIKPTEWMTMIPPDEAQGDVPGIVRCAMEMGAAMIDEQSAPENVLGSINGYLVLRGTDGEPGMVIREEYLEPCRDGVRQLHLIPEGKSMVMVYCGDELTAIVGDCGEGKAIEIHDRAHRMEVCLRGRREQEEQTDMSDLWE